jgi:hypothetical protein
MKALMPEPSSELPFDKSLFPTHRHAPAFWEALGRAVGTFSFLEEVLGRAIFAFTGDMPVVGPGHEAAVEEWVKGDLYKALSETLHPLAMAFEKAVRAHQGSISPSTRHTIDEVLKLIPLRNALCHGSWGVPDAMGRSVPLFVTKKPDVKKAQIFLEPIDAAYLQQVRIGVADLAQQVMAIVHDAELPFPGTTAANA